MNQSDRGTRNSESDRTGSEDERERGEAGCGGSGRSACGFSLSRLGGGSSGKATGDHCTAAGTGTAYTLNIIIPSGAPQQFGFAFGASGTTVTNINLAGAEGTFSTQALPPAASGSGVTQNPIEPGSSVVSLVTSAPVKGPFSVVSVRAAQPQPAYLQPITCTLASTAAVVSNAFTVDRHPTYDAAGHVWHLAVTIPGPGTVSAIQPEPSIGTAAAHSTTIGVTLVQVRKVGLTSAGKVTLTIRLTPHGQRTLAAKGSIEPTLAVSFAPRDSKPATQRVTLTLRT